VNTLAWILILAAIVIGRQVAKGRALNLPDDLSDAFLAFTRGDTNALTEVLSRTGDSATASSADLEAVGKSVGGIVTDAAAHAGIAGAAISLGTKAKGYRWAASGPEYYDCSGLMYRACQQGAGYKGPRFNTTSVLQQTGMQRTNNPTTGDMVLWPVGSGGVTGHMGVITGADEFYSARSVKSGIGYSKISTFRKPPPIYVRYVKS